MAKQVTEPMNNAASDFIKGDCPFIKLPYFFPGKSGSLPMKLSFNHEIFFVLLSILIQIPLAIFLGHYYDDRIFMGTGYLVSSGFNPYLQHNFVNVFPSSILSGIVPSIGYPALWPIWLGIAYKFSYGLTQNIFLYNFAIKLPLIVAQVGLAYLVKHILTNFDLSKRKAQTAFLLVLFNPFIMLTTAAWGEFDTLVIVLSLASLYLLSKNKIITCALFLGLAVALKPIALPLAPLPLFYSGPDTTNKKKLAYASIFLGTLLICYFGPFLVAMWRIPLSPTQLSDQLQMAGGITLFSAVEFFQPLAILPAALGFLGYLWVPALVIAFIAVYLDRPCDLSGLIKKAILVMLVFFLFRTWVSEPNINILLPLILLSASLEEIKFRDFHLSWIIPLVFMFPNYAIPQLFFLVNPSIMSSLQLFNVQFGSMRLLARFLVAVIWEIFALKIALKMFDIRRNSSIFWNKLTSKNKTS
jgi:hypothetical protein